MVLDVKSDEGNYFSSGGDFKFSYLKNKQHKEF